MSQKVLFGSSEPVYVDLLNYNLNNKAALGINVPVKARKQSENTFTSYILVFKNFLLGLVLHLWSLDVVCLDPKLWPLHGQRVQALEQNMSNVSISEHKQVRLASGDSQILLTSIYYRADVVKYRIVNNKV